MEVTVIVPCRNESKYIVDCIESILLAIKTAAVSGEILIVDGLSDDGTIGLINEIKSRDSRVKYFENPKQIAPYALNIGLREARGDVIFRVDAHVIVNTEFVKRSLETMAELPKAGCVGGFVESAYTDELSRTIGVAMNSRFGVGNARFRTSGVAGYVDTLAFGAYRKAVFEKCGLFDETLIRNQDDEFNYRIRKRGFGVYFDPRIKSLYFVRNSIQKLRRQYTQYGYWKVYVNQKHKSITTLRQLAPLAILTVFLALPFSIIVLRLSSLWALNVFAGTNIMIALVYLIFLVGISFAKSISFKLNALRLIQIFATLHFSYGFGYLMGLVDFFLLNKQPSSDYASLSR